MLERSGGRLFSERSIVAAALGGSSVRSAEMCLPPGAEAVPGMPPGAEAVPGALPTPERKPPLLERNPYPLSFSLLGILYPSLNFINIVRRNPAGILSFF